MAESDRTARILDDIRVRLGLGDEVRRDWYESDVSFLLGERDRLEKERDTFATRLNRLDDLVEQAAALTEPGVLEIEARCRRCGHTNVHGRLTTEAPTAVVCSNCGNEYEVEVGWVKP